MLKNQKSTSQNRFPQINRGRQKYQPEKIEFKWQEEWSRAKLFSPDLDLPVEAGKKKKPYYNLMMFPYPSAEGLHVGNMYAFTGSDIWGRYHRMLGFDVFEPIGLDGFGIHSENYAIKVGEHPKDVSKRTEEHFYKQLKITGNAYDWNRTLETYDHAYYKWTQWLFVQMFKNSLAYRQNATVNWCPSCKTVLADEQVIKDECERCGTKVELKKLEQWFFKITRYADKLLEGLDKIDWPEKIKIAQRNWIGKKEGIDITYGIKGNNGKVVCWTSRPDTNFGATFIVLAPEHPLALKLATKENKKAVKEYIKSSESKSKDDRIAQGRQKTGVFTGSYAINMLNGKELPVWISDFVLMEFGTGAVVGVPGHDKRDFEFAKNFKLPVKRVVVGKNGDTSPIKDIEQVQEEEGKMVNSQFLNGLDIHTATQKVMDYLEKKGWGKRKITYHLRDWLISRQRYWGPPIPMIYCEKCAKNGKSWFTTSEAAKYKESRIKNQESRNKNHDSQFIIHNSMLGWYPVPEDQLPVELPFIKNYQPKGIRSTGSGQAGESPLSQDKNFVNVECPHCGSPARRETDVSDTFLDSSWYFLRYLATEFDDLPFPSEEFVERNKKNIKNWKLKIENSSRRTRGWLPVHMYIGGAEHSVLHLLYVRFIWKALCDWGYIEKARGYEPFPRFYGHGLIVKDGAKMSKSKGNVVNPDEYIAKYGTDSLRCYLMFLGPYDMGGDFRDTGMEGMYRFIKRVWNLVISEPIIIKDASESRDLYRQIHQTVKRVTDDMEGLRFNRAIAGIMEYVNTLRAQTQNSKLKTQKYSSKLKSDIKCAEWDEAIRTLLLLFAPFAPHMAEELWQKLEPGVRNQESRNKKQNSQFISYDSIHFQTWPKYNPEFIKEDIIEIAVEINGKTRSVIKISSDQAHDQQSIETAAKENSKIKTYLQDKKIKKIIFVPEKLINFVVV